MLSPFFNLQVEAILIIQSNTFDLYNIKSILASNLSQNRGLIETFYHKTIIHCDPVNGGSIFQIIPSQSQKDEVEFHECKTIHNVDVDINSECNSIPAENNSKLIRIKVWKEPYIFDDIALDIK
jgi:hypothetical protein